MNKKTKPTFIGVGGQKCATTWISECLRWHPQIFMSSPKELHFFSGDMKKGAEWYLDFFKSSEKYTTRGEYSTSYLHTTGTAKKIYDNLGSVQILIAIRNPVDRFTSHYKHLIRDGALNAPAHNTLTLKNYQDSVSKYPELLKNGLYSEYINHYIKQFNRKKVHIMVKEQIDENAKGVLTKLYDFLNVESNYTPPILNKKVSPGIIPKSQNMETFRQKVYSVLNKALPIAIIIIRRLRLAEVYRKLNKSKDEFSIDENVTKELISYYKEDIAKTEKILGDKLKYW